MKYTHTIILTVSIILTSTMVRADGDCPLPSQVSWWSNLSHASITKYVDRKLGGDWNTYVDKWEIQLDLLMDVYARNSEVVIRSKNLRLKGNSLANYIDDVRERLAITRCLAKSVPAKIQTVNPAKGRALSKSAGCTECHGENGMGTQPMTPNLAGQKARYLSLQLRRLRNGERRTIKGDVPNAARIHKELEAATAQLSDQDVGFLAAYYAKQSCKLLDQSPITSPLPQMKGCVLCHDKNGRGRNLSIPNLAGQPWEYLAKQLYLFKATANNEHFLDGTEFRAHPIMSEEARKLSNGEIKELAMYYAGLKCE